MMTFSILIPVYRNKETLRSLYTGICKALEKENLNAACQWVFVDDASDDGSAGILQSISAENPAVHCLRNETNTGQVPAILNGLKRCSGEAVIIQSADMQEPPEMIPAMIHAWQKGHPLVIALRDTRDDAWMNRLQSRLFFGLMRTLHPSIPKGGFDFVLVSGAVLHQLRQLPVENRFLQADILNAGCEPHYIGYHRSRRTGGNSQWNLQKKIDYLLKGIFYKKST